MKPGEKWNKGPRVGLSGGAGESGKGMREEEARRPWGTGPAGSEEGSPHPMLGTAQPPKLGFLNIQPFTIVERALDMESSADSGQVSSQACHICFLSLRY